MATWNVLIVRGDATAVSAQASGLYGDALREAARLILDPFYRVGAGSPVFFGLGGEEKPFAVLSTQEVLVSAPVQASGGGA